MSTDQSLYSCPSVHKDCFSDVFSSVTHSYKRGLDAQLPAAQNRNYNILRFGGTQPITKHILILEFTILGGSRASFEIPISQCCKTEEQGH